MEEEENKLLKQAKEELAYLSGDKDFKRLVEARVGFLRDQNTKEICGEERGRKERTIEIAKKMLMENMKITDIMRLTDLTEEEINKIKKK